MDYTLLDFGSGKRLEQWGPYRLVRPDPTAVGSPVHTDTWEQADAIYEGEKGKGTWVKRTPLPDSWPVAFGNIQLTIRLAPYKHTGAFPEQQQNWEWMRGMAKKGTAPRTLSILNLFAYTGGATMALAKDGHHVTHVDSSRPAIGWAKENATLNQLPPDRIRWMLEDAATFVARERKRGHRYDAIILDPPAYGHGPSGNAWRSERDLAPLLEECCALLSDDPAFILLNGYAHGDTPENFHRLLTGIVKSRVKKRSHVEAEEVMLQAADGRKLSTGVVARCAFMGQ